MIRLVRRVTFSAGHRYWKPELTPEENRACFGPFASPYNHGHNYVLDVSAEGPVDSDSGMVVNIKTIDAVLQQEVVSRYHLKSLNDEVPPFDRKPPSLENLLADIARLLLPHFQTFSMPARLTALRLEEMPDLYAQFDLETTMTTITRAYEFCAAHRLHSPTLDDASNAALYGKCNNPSGHGHNYVLEVTVGGDVDPTTGMIVDVCAIDDAVNREVVDRYDHKNLNCDLPEFAGKVTTSEVIVQEIWNRLQATLPARLERVRLYETARSAFEVTR